MNILIVDDEPLKRDLIKKSVEGALRGKEFQITCLEYGLDALMEMMCNHYDCVITDMRYQWKEESNIDNKCGKKLLREMEESEVSTKAAIVCSSDKEDVNEFDRVIDYIIYQGKDLSDKFEQAFGKLR